MSDYDRGAYTPQYDEELAFDPRRPHGKRPLPLTLIASAAVLVVLAGAVALAYRSGVRSPGEAPHTVGKPVLSVKSAPGPDAQAQDQTMNLDVYDAQTDAHAPAPPVQPAATAAPATAPDAPAAGAPVPAAVPAGPPPAFAPPPEQPVIRPHPRVIRAAPLKSSVRETADEPATGNMTATADTGWQPAKAAPAPAEVKSEPAHAKTAKAESAASETSHARTAKAETTARAAKPHAAEGTAPVGKLAANEAKPVATSRDAESDEADAEAAPVTVKKTAAKPNTAPAKAASEPKAATAKVAPEGTQAAGATSATAHGKFMVQIGAFASSALADKGYAAVASTLPGQMSGKGKHVEPVDHNGKTLYRTTVTGFASRADAVSFCEALKAKGKICFVKG